MKIDYSPVAYTGQFWIQENRSPACTHCAVVHLADGARGLLTIQRYAQVHVRWMVSACIARWPSSGWVDSCMSWQWEPLIAGMPRRRLRPRPQNWPCHRHPSPLPPSYGDIYIKKQIYFVSFTSDWHILTLLSSSFPFVVSYLRVLLVIRVFVSASDSPPPASYLTFVPGLEINSPGVLLRSLTNNVSIYFNINV